MPRGLRGSRLGRIASGAAGRPARLRSTKVLTVPVCNRAAHGLRSSAAAEAKPSGNGARSPLGVVAA